MPQSTSLVISVITVIGIATLTGLALLLVNWLARKSIKQEPASNLSDSDLLWEVIEWLVDRIRKLEDERKD